ncbi:MAG: Ig-like domain-containing protein, partial [Spirochaetia bacterium]|nr:Ig-like domain-containing protein [Spirochaetia bacterium]
MISKKYLNIKVNLSFIIVLTLIFTGSCSNIEHDKISGSFGKPLLSVASGFLEVDFSEPAINDEYYPNNKKILINFDMPIDASTVIDTDTIVFQTLKADGEVKLTCTGDIQIIGESITYLPTGPIGSSCEDVSDRLARLTLRAGGIGSTVDGTTYFLQNDYTLTHEVTRRGDQDIEPPIIQNITPENNAVHVSSATNILVVFSEAIDPASINDINFSVLDAGEAVAGSFLIEGANVTFTPNVPLTNFTTYT